MCSSLRAQKPVNHSGAIVNIIWGPMSQVLVMIFIFGNTLKTTFEAIIFLFVMHPFDVGDRCLIDGVQVPTNFSKIVRLPLDDEIQGSNMCNGVSFILPLS